MMTPSPIVPSKSHMLRTILVVLSGALIILAFRSFSYSNPNIDGYESDVLRWRELRAAVERGEAAQSVVAAQAIVDQYHHVPQVTRRELERWRSLARQQEQRETAQTAYRAFVGGATSNPIANSQRALEVLTAHRTALDPDQVAVLQTTVSEGQRHRYVHLERPMRRNSRGRTTPCPDPAVRAAGAQTWQQPTRRYWALQSEPFRYEARCSATSRPRTFEVHVGPGQAASPQIVTPLFD